MRSDLRLWAKLGTSKWPEEYHPVLCHMIDVGCVSVCIWREVVRNRLRKHIARGIGIENPDDVGPWLGFLIGAHDIGKASPDFQCRNVDARWAALEAELRKEEYRFKPGKAERHEILSSAILVQELQKQSHPWGGIDPTTAYDISLMLGGHHGSFPTGEWDATRGTCPRWHSAQVALLDDLADLFGVDGRPKPGPNRGDPSDKSAWMYLAGLTSVADWIGSNQEFFPSTVTPECRPESLDIPAYFASAQAKAMQALETLGWLSSPAGGGTKTFGELFTGIAAMRPLQTAVVERMAADPEAKLLIVEAPMGEGKTEAAWFVADQWHRQHGQGAYVALPTMATSNQMFGRVGKFLEDAAAGKTNLMLQHGKASLNEKFGEMKYAARIYDANSTSCVVAESWFAANKKHGLLAPYGVGTIDQALLSVLQTKHGFVRLFGLAGKCVILDEVHAYDTYMSTLMERMLTWLRSLGCTVVLLSATLPKERRESLLKAWAGADAKIGADSPYPRLTTAVAGRVEVRGIAADPTRARTLRLQWLDDSDLVANLREGLKDGGCAVVIRNTVGLAQQTFRELQAGLADMGALEGGIRFALFHARFPFGRRQQIEEAVLNIYGKTGDRPYRSVLVATQVVEQSLDLDFDIMISDVGPVDLVLQRAGRLWRHERDNRRCAVTQPTLWLIRPDETSEVPKFGVSEFVYERAILLRSFAALTVRQAVELPADLEPLMEMVYGDLPLEIPESWRADLAESEAKAKECRDSDSLKGEAVLIYEPTDEMLFEQRSGELEEDDPDAHKSLRAATRLTEDSVSLIVVWHDGGVDYLDREKTVRLVSTRKPTTAQTRAIVMNEVTLQYRGCVWHYVKRDPVAAWEESGILRYHRVARFGPDGQAMDGFAMTLSEELGIEFERRSEN